MDAPRDEPDPIYGTRRTVYLEPAEYARYVWQHRQDLFTAAELAVHTAKVAGETNADWPGFSARAITRIRDVHAAELDVHRCPRGHVFATPDADQCPWCGT